jgi:hypothetical protein
MGCADEAKAAAAHATCAQLKSGSWCMLENSPSVCHGTKTPCSC